MRTILVVATLLVSVLGFGAQQTSCLKSGRISRPLPIAACTFENVPSQLRTAYSRTSFVLSNSVITGANAEAKMKTLPTNDCFWQDDMGETYFIERTREIKTIRLPHSSGYDEVEILTSTEYCVKSPNTTKCSIKCDYIYDAR